ncbi:Uncharacterised protein [uncultured archaeon]|nr:Uncharacterised protein [uncultured archaeon]
MLVCAYCKKPTLTRMSDVTPLVSGGVNLSKPHDLIKKTIKGVEELPELPAKAIEKTAKIIEEPQKTGKKILETTAEIIAKSSRELAIGAISAGTNDYYCTTCQRKTIVIDIDEVNPDEPKK